MAELRNDSGALRSTTELVSRVAAPEPSGGAPDASVLASAGLDRAARRCSRISK